MIDIAKDTYISHIPNYLSYCGFGSSEIQEMDRNLELSTLSITQAKPIAIHRDPHTPYLCYALWAYHSCGRRRGVDGWEL